jgi:hypothetical protein
MDIIVRGGDNIADPDDLLALQPGQEYPIWRGKKPSHAQAGDRVYFVGEGAIYLYATYAGYEYRSEENLQEVHQSGWAMLVTAPVTPIDPPYRLDPAILRGGWPWRYDCFNLRQHL